MNKYEAVIMFYPEVEEEKRNASFERLKKVIEKNGKINNVDEINRIAKIMDPVMRQMIIKVED